MNSMLALGGKIAVFLIGAYLGGKHVTDYWVVGPIFGLVVVIWQATSLRALVTLRSGAFVVASTLIYALVLWLYGALLHPFSTQRDYSFVAMIAGTALLPLAHAWCFKVSWRRVLVAIPAIYALTYLVGFLGDAVGLDKTPLADFLYNGVTVWQGAYLLLMFGWRKGC